VEEEGSITDNKYAKIFLDSLPETHYTIISTIKTAALICEKNSLPEY
jgi:hypothetical protein